MTIRVALHHLTQYRYDRPVSLSPQIVRLRPAAHSRTKILSYSLDVRPKKHFINWQQDPFGNYLARLVFQEQVRELTVQVDLVAEMTVINPFDFFLEETAHKFPFTYAPELARSLIPYLEVEKPGPLLARFVAQVNRKPRSVIDFLVDLNQRLWREVKYSIRMEPGVLTPEETLSRGIGSCRDSGWLLVQVLRHLGLAARFVSGYLVQLKADEKSLDGPSGPEADFTDLHAWCEVFLPGAGWVGLDPTSGLFAGEGHIPLACTPFPGAASPIEGFSDKCETEFSYRNEVTRIHEDPRVTLPYSDHDWALIDALGNMVDERLAEDDVRLTMGGEPTFVSIDDVHSAQWNTAADGAHKRERAEDLLRRLRETFAPGGVLHHGQGKWYPGEPLPRWAKTCFYRQDGQPIWRDAALLAAPERSLGHAIQDARHFANMLLQALGIDSDYLQPAWEDVFHLMWQREQLPEDIDPAKLKPGDRAAYQRIQRALGAGDESPVGFVLPLEYDWHTGWFATSPWRLRRGRVVLVPGDSAVGLRLPLSSLPWHEDLADQPPDPMDTSQPHQFVAHAGAPGGPPAAPARRSTVVQGRVIHTALCVEARDGVVHVFLPPMPSIDGWLALMRCLEQAAERAGVPIAIEGYEPPRDNRIVRFSVTPDPGVIEVNVQPSKTWPELKHVIENLYEQARQSRLGTEKFLVDGRHTGTGGGYHVTLGGATPPDSPLLRRPQLLRSLINFWQHHPGLSYMFSGLFVGPTSQAPRVDEGRDDRLYELEIAFQQLPDGESERPWVVDRALRHLLTDITGNTHRSEFCIDKLYSPDSATGRLGLLEFRGFEMPPHARMSLAQMLFLRCLVAWFWRDPYKRPLHHWGTLLHDRFMLPHYVWRDIADVVAELNRAGFPFQLHWLAPFLEFRFPVYGRVQFDDMQLEIRAAIEPWNVLGEEVVSGGTARFVDSSVERLQVRVTGIDPNRYVVACNGRRVPLRSTGVRDEFVAGVRFQAWQPPSSLHPTIPVQSPLVFDLIDTWNGRAVAGCTYHVSHAGGRSFERPPINAFEAESRRVARFWGMGHTVGALPVPWTVERLTHFAPRGELPHPMAPPIEDPHPAMPYTLDLRQMPSPAGPASQPGPARGGRA